MTLYCSLTPINHLKEILKGTSTCMRCAGKLLHAFQCACVCVCSQSLSLICLCDPMDCRTPGLPVPHHLPEFAQVHFHCIGDTIQPSHPLMPSSPPTLNLYQHQGLFQCVHLFSSDGRNTGASASAYIVYLHPVSASKELIN